MRSIDVESDSYLDTRFVVAAAVNGSHHSIAAHQEWLRLVSTRRSVYFSSFLRVEVTQALFRMGANPARLPADVRARYILDRWEHDFLIRHRWMVQGIEAFETLLATFAEVYELPVTTEIWQHSVPIMAHYRLWSIDAVHVATAQMIGIRNFITCDLGFGRVDGLHVILVRDQS
ncbi:MAG TPA: type II toxin-antitoxin system VapC family toxin [Thermomicrobiales bacterium]|nr:type II toxin-antitoxin system VapC family toxin [Thermomicrobiales bacterium]